VEESETFEVTLANPMNVILGQRSQIIVSVEDDDDAGEVAPPADASSDPCEGEVGPFNEVDVCDGVDNDCDGTIDEDCVEESDAGTDCPVCPEFPDAGPPSPPDALIGAVDVLVVASARALKITAQAFLSCLIRTS